MVVTVANNGSLLFLYLVKHGQNGQKNKKYDYFLVKFGQINPLFPVFYEFSMSSFVTLYTQELEVGWKKKREMKRAKTSYFCNLGNGNGNSLLF